MTLRFVLPPHRSLIRAFSKSGFVLLDNAVPKTLAKCWQRRATELVGNASVAIHRDSDGHLLSYRVVTGDVISREWSELFSFYSAPHVLQWIAGITGSDRVFRSRNLRSAININSMDSPNQAYRWHYDALPFTLILFLSTSAPEDGGAFELSNNGVRSNRAAISILPKAGSLLLMDGTRCLHRAAPLLRPTQRLTVPMVYPNIEDDSRPDGLDDYLYSAQST